MPTALTDLVFSNDCLPTGYNLEEVVSQLQTVLTATETAGEAATTHSSSDGSDHSDVVANTAAVAALLAANTDGEVAINLLAGQGDAGTWTKAITSGGLLTVTRTAGAATESFWALIAKGNRTTASKGFMPTGLTVNYSVDTADATDVRAEVWKKTAGADGASPTAAVLFGDADEDYDEAHNTAAERGDDTGAPELHRMDVVDAGTPAYLAADEELWLRFVVIDPGTSDVVLRQASLLYTEAMNDTA